MGAWILSSEIFRFVALRRPQITSAKNSRIIKISLGSTEGDSPFIKVLKDAKRENNNSSAAREKMTKIAKDYLESEDFVNPTTSIDERYYRLAMTIQENEDKPIKDYLKPSYQSIFSEHARDLVNSPEFKKGYQRVKNSLIASIIVDNQPEDTNSYLVSMLHTFYLIAELGKDLVTTSPLTDARILLPGEIFPLPAVGHSLAEQRKEDYEKRKEAAEKIKKKLAESAQTLDNNQLAVKEIISTFEKAEPNGEAKDGGFVLSPHTRKGLSDISKRVLKTHGFGDDGELDVAKSVALIEKSSADTARELYRNMGQDTMMVRVGAALLPDHAVATGGVESYPDGFNPTRLVPGICPLAAVEEFSAGDGKVTVPMVNGGKRKPIIGDLIIVEQKLSRYEMGEIAHIENVLNKEFREREFRTKKTMEESRTIETEETKEEVKDLATTDRYELQSESQNSINEAASYQAGATISYDGPTVDATANYGMASSNSSQESQRVASNYAREITARAASRVERRKLETRFTRTVEEIEDKNLHRFDNTTGTGHISGIYRWVDKIYEAQMINYGKKLMLEFIVPEPAAFIRYAATKMLNGEVASIVRPDPPGSCMSDGKTFQPLRVEDIDPNTYLYWVAKYNVEDVSPPPSVLVVVSASKVNNGGEGEMRQVSFRDADTAAEEVVTIPFLEITVPAPPDKVLYTWAGTSESSISVPDGYLPKEAHVNLKGLQCFSKATLTVQIQDQEVSNQTIGGYGSVSLPMTKTASIPFTIESFGFAAYEVIVNVFCVRSIEKYQEWQLATYQAIINSYNDKKSRYDTAVEAAKVRAGFNQIQGKNPLLNREIEKIELKKGCISLLTGQRFDDFDAVTVNAAPLGFPELDFEEAKAEGDYIKFFEQAFEWQNMTYLFYPYFWSNKKEWVMLSSLDDADPLYTRFLQAGSARVQVPIRDGFQPALASFLSGAKIWSAKGAFLLDDKIDPNLLSIAEEFRSQSGNNSINGKGTLKLSKDSANVEGTDTEFSDADQNRQIRINGRVYVIKRVQSATNILLKTAYAGDSEDNVEYSLGGILVGQPWEIRLPTNLVRLESVADALFG